MESFLIFALQFILRQKSVKGNVTITILYLKVFHTHTHNLYFTDFTLKLFIVIFCYCPVSLCPLRLLQLGPRPGGYRMLSGHNTSTRPKILLDPEFEWSQVLQLLYPNYLARTLMLSIKTSHKLIPTLGTPP